MDELLPVLPRGENGFHNIEFVENIGNFTSARTSEIADIFNTRDEIFLVFTPPPPPPQKKK